MRARKPENSEILQLIPRIKLVDDFPRHFVHEYIHWLDLKTGELEFRPTGFPWTPRPSNWRLYLQNPSDQKKKKGLGTERCVLLQKPCQDIPPTRLIDIRSSTFRVVSSLLSPLEFPEHIIATHTAQTLEVSLPRFRLSFFVNRNWELECRSIPGYVLDKTQSCGTMFGLRNKLIFCSSATNSEEPLLPRRVIIPKGKISLGRSGNFTTVSITPDDEEHVRWHEFTIDTNLGCLTGNASLSSRLYQCYLHAVTSHCLPDPLLGHTGTEEALYILRSAACRSFQRLDVEETMLLQLIGNLTPHRNYFSSRLGIKKARVTWDDLPLTELSRHHDFFPAVCSLLDHARTLAALYDQRIDLDMRRNQTLLNRASILNRIYYPSDLHVSRQFNRDDEYWSRDVSNLGTAEHVAFQTSWS